MFHQRDVANRLVQWSDAQTELTHRILCRNVNAKCPLRQIHDAGVSIALHFRALDNMIIRRSRSRGAKLGEAKFGSSF